MKVLTKEALEYRLNRAKNDPCMVGFILALIHECREIDALTVSELRPMSEAPRNGKFLVVLNSEDDFHECSFLADGRVKIGTVAIRDEYCVGWIPKPIYKPKEMIWPNACG